MKYELALTLKQRAHNEICFEHVEEYPLEDKILGVFGESGTGKTTLLKALSGLAPNAKYMLRIDDKTYRNLSGVKNPCVYVGHDAVLFEHLNVQDNLALVSKLGGSSKNLVLSHGTIIELCSIQGLLNRRVNELSSGEKQRVQFARALLSGKSTILLDEAFSALDWPARTGFLERIKLLAKNYQMRFILVSHSLQELAIACDDIWVLNKGRFVLQNDANTVIDSLLMGSSDVYSYATPSLHKIFSLIQILYVGEDELDNNLEHWQIPSLNTEPAQLLVKKRGLPLQQATAQSTVRRALSAKSTMSLIIEADKISLSRQQFGHVSMLNCLKGSVYAIHEPNARFSTFSENVIITLKVNGQLIRSAITKRSFIDMQIKKEDTLFAVFKAL